MSPSLYWFPLSVPELPMCSRIWNARSAVPGSIRLMDMGPDGQALGRHAELIYEHKYGRDVSAYGSYRAAEAALVTIVRDPWKGRADRDAPDEASSLSDNEAITACFDGYEDGFYAIEEIEVEFQN